MRNLALKHSVQAGITFNSPETSNLPTGNGIGPSRYLS